MKNSLKTLERIQKFKIDEQRKIMVDLQNKEDKILNDLRRLIKEYEQEKEFAAQNGYIGDFGAYTKRYLEFRRWLENELEQVRRKIAEVRDVIADMFKEQKTYEIVDDNRKKRELKEDDLKNQKMLDEIGTNAYIKRNKNN